MGGAVRELTDRRLRWRCLGPAVRVTPSIKTPADRDSLWQALRDGTIDVLASDHAPHEAPMKLVPSVWEAAGGWPGLETTMPLMLEAVATGRLLLGRLLDAFAVRPAQLFGFYPRKGRLAVGSDADVSVVDLEGRWTIDQARMHSKSKLTPFDGWTGRGRVETTILRGAVVFIDGEIVGGPRGAWIRP